MFIQYKNYLIEKFLSLINSCSQEIRGGWQSLWDHHVRWDTLLPAGCNSRWAQGLDQSHSKRLKDGKITVLGPSHGLENSKLTFKRHTELRVRISVRMCFVYAPNMSPLQHFLKIKIPVCCFLTFRIYTKQEVFWQSCDNFSGKKPNSHKLETGCGQMCCFTRNW